MASFLNDAVFISEYHDEERHYWAALERPSQRPFSLDVGTGTVFYYLSTAVDGREAGNIALKMHNCRVANQWH